jgi:hypothetical protein
MRRPSFLFRFLPAALLALLPAAAGAIDLTDKVFLSGFGHWQYGKTDGNSLGNATEDGDFDDGSFALSLSAQVSDPVRVAGQFHFDFDGEADLDFAFAEYSVSDAFKLRAGLVKQPFGISTEVFRVSTLRNFGDLPQSLYGPSGLVSEGLKGLAFSGRRNFASGWAVSYDVYGGELNPFNDSLNDRLLEGGEEEEEEDVSYRNVLGVRGVVETPVEGLSAGLSAYRGTEEEDDRTVETLGTDLHFIRGAWDVRGEYFYQHPESGAIEQTGFYVEVARRFGERWQLAGRYEILDIVLKSEELAPFKGDPRLDHDVIAAGLNYWVSPNLVFRTSLSQIEHLRFATPPEDEDADEADEDTRLFTFGVDFSF